MGSNKPLRINRLYRNQRNVLLAVCWVLLFIWCVWWFANFYHQKMQIGGHFWFKPCPIGIGCDFYRHVDNPARIWLNGGDPYAEELLFPYPPSEMRLFAWVNLMSPKAAYGAWLTILTTIIALSAWIASKWRRRLLLVDIPPIMAIVIMLFSTPVLFALERGQYDSLSILAILVSLPLLNYKSNSAQFLAGSVLCFAPYVKVYPGLIVVGLLGLKRWYASAGFIFSGLIIAAFFLYNGELQKFLINNAQHIQEADNAAYMFSGAILPWNHPLSTALSGIWLGTKFNWIGLFPAKVLAVMLLFLILAWVTYYVYKCPNRHILSYPYLLWIVALATFVPPVSNDYNLCFLPLAVLCVWDLRDPLRVQVALALFLIWWQPIGVLSNGTLMILIKLLGLGATAVCLVRRAREQTMRQA